MKIIDWPLNSHDIPPLRRRQRKMGKGQQKSFDRRRWQEKNNCMLKLLKPLFAGINGIHIASESKKQTGAADKSLTYGEIQPQSFLSILSSVVPKSDRGGVFVDLGCGTGLAVMCAALSAFSFDKCWGIEIVPELTEAARSCEALLQSCLVVARENMGSVTAVGQKGRGVADGSGRKKKENFKEGTGKGEAGPKEADAALLSVVDVVIGSNNPATEEIAVVFDIEAVVAALLKHVGHKEYKKLLKGKYKTFKRFLEKHPERFLLLDDSAFTLTVPSSSKESDNDMQQVEISSSSCVKRVGNDTNVMNDDSNIIGAMCLASLDATDDGEEKVVPKLKIATKYAADIIESDAVHSASNINAESESEREREVIIDLIQNSSGGRYLLTEAPPLPHIRLDTADLFSMDWWSGREGKEQEQNEDGGCSAPYVVYCASLLFSEEMMGRLTEKVWLMQPGAWFITLKPLTLDLSGGSESVGGRDASSTRDGKVITLVSDSFYKMSWHMARVYIYQIREREAI